MDWQVLIFNHDFSQNVAMDTPFLKVMYYTVFDKNGWGGLNMIEEHFQMTLGDDRTIEKVIQDENLHYMHMILNKDEGLPEHFSNATVYMTVLRGKLSIKLGDQQIHEYQRGSVLRIPFNTKMNVRNLHEETLEITVVKAPAPQK